MPYLIDGHNLIPKVPGLSLQSIDDEIQLIHKLQDFCRRSGKIVEVYFDNAPAGQTGMRRYGSIKAHFIRQGRTADEAIIARLRSLGRSARNWSVVSSDRRVISDARALQAQVISAADFARLIVTVEPGIDSRPEVDPDLSLNDDEIDEWMKIFRNSEDTQD